MVSTVEILDHKISHKRLLKHPFYQAWSNGELSLADLRHYARQYFAHVRAFPAYLSEMHCRCEDLESRRIIARNLADEEAGSPTHPELWLDFAAGLGAARESVLGADVGPRVNALVETYRSVSRMKTGAAAAGLYCYEKQIPEVASAKMAGLERHYGVADPATVRYFRVHESADVEHSAQWEAMLSREEVSPDLAAGVADQVLDALWGALDEIYEGRPAAAAVS
ncbi:MAG: CADD family putative folate metabolism protein [Acidobacteria bacterium]|nr:CADD family putative folate metabolism protein [Acidobacteriota bacterium]